MSGGDAPVKVSRSEVLAFRLNRHQLAADRAGVGVEDLGLLDYGVQDTGHAGSSWALAIRSASPDVLSELALVWTVRGAPHVYRRRDLADVAVATAPLSEADAAARIYDAAKPLKEAGLSVLDALATVASAMRELVTKPMSKGDLSAQLTERLPGPYIRFCRPCDVHHLFEMPFRLAALQAGLELDFGTSPPQLRRIKGLSPPLFRHPGGAGAPRFDVIRSYLRFFGPARVKDAAKFLDAPVREVKLHWPEDTVEVQIKGDPDVGRRGTRFVLEEDLEALGASGRPEGTQLLGQFDPYVQLRDRELLVPEEAHRQDLWRTLGRPGAVLVDGEVRGTWRPRAKGSQLELDLTTWQDVASPARAVVEARAEALAAHRELELARVSWS